jgi:hypothetical protein
VGNADGAWGADAPKEKMASLLTPKTSPPPCVEAERQRVEAERVRIEDDRSRSEAFTVLGHGMLGMLRSINANGQSIRIATQVN